MTPAGQLNRRIVIRAATATADLYGGTTETVADVATVWAKVEPLQGNEQLLAMQTGMTRPHRFVIRYRSDVTGATEIQYGAQRFNVTSVTDTDARRRELEILADEVRST